MIEEENKKKNKDRLIKILLVIIIIILLFITSCSVYRQVNKSDIKTPTGNVDIFEIKCDKVVCKPTKKPDDNPIVKPDDNKENEPEIEPGTGGFDVYEGNLSWKSVKTLNILANPMYNMQKKIAPEDSNTYQFVVKNSTNITLNYSIDFTESNPYQINLMYKLRKGDTYLAGDENTWVKTSDLNIKDLKIDSSKSDTFYLDWKWVSSNNDTKIGQTKNAGYRLDINLKAEGI